MRFAQRSRAAKRSAVDFVLRFAHATDSASVQITPPSCICIFSLRCSTFLINSDFESCVWNWRYYVFLLNFRHREFADETKSFACFHFIVKFAHCLPVFNECSIFFCTLVYRFGFCFYNSVPVTSHSKRFAIRDCHFSAIWIRTLDLRLKTFPKTAAVADMMVVHTN